MGSIIHCAALFFARAELPPFACQPATPTVHFIKNPPDFCYHEGPGLPSIPDEMPGVELGVTFAVKA
jgi:hypothetical protein